MMACPALFVFAALLTLCHRSSPDMAFGYCLVLFAVFMLACRANPVLLLHFLQVFPKGV